MERRLSTDWMINTFPRAKLKNNSHLRSYYKGGLKLRVWWCKKHRVELKERKVKYYCFKNKCWHLTTRRVKK